MTGESARAALNLELARSPHCLDRGGGEARKGQGRLQSSATQQSPLDASEKLMVSVGLAGLRLGDVAMRDCDSLLISQKYRVHRSSDHQHVGGG